METLQVQSGRGSNPILAKNTVSISEAERGRLSTLAHRLLRDEPALSSTEAFGDNVSAGLFQAPAVLIGDHSEIPLADQTGTSVLGYRISHLAEQGDLLILNSERSPAFEAYRDRYLGLGQLDVLVLPSGNDAAETSIARRCVEQADVFQIIKDLAQRERRLNIIPHIGTGSVWRLGAAIAANNDIEIKICAPPPRLTKRVNDKLWFTQQVSEILGSEALPLTFSAFGPEALAHEVSLLSRRWPNVVIKVPDSAGSAGNVRLNSDEIKTLDVDRLRSQLLEWLRSLGWHDRYPIMVEVWDHPIVSSPSVQVWVPEREQGMPIVEGVFEQVVAGLEGKFIGAVPAALPNSWEERLANDATRIAYLFQQLGYFGRCSFDAVIAGEDYATGELHWIECNGRWGGVSVPMTLMVRLIGDWSKHPFVIVQRENMNIPPRDFAEVLKLLEGQLYKHGRDKRGVVLLTPGAVERGSGVHFLSLGDTLDEAKATAMNVIEILSE